MIRTLRIFHFSLLLALLASCTASRVGTYNKIDRDDMQKSINKYLGTPYKWGGTEPKAGVDCSGFTSGVYSDQGIIIPRTSRLQYTVGDAVARHELQYGDLLFFDTLNKGVSHVGIFIKDNQMVHASSSKGVTYSNFNTDYWKKRYIGARRLTGSKLVAGEIKGEQHVVASAYPFMIRRIIDIPTTDVIENRFFGLDIQNQLGGNLRLGGAFSLWNRWEIGAEMQIDQFLGDDLEAFGFEPPFLQTKFRLYQQKGKFPSLAIGAESMARKWTVKNDAIPNTPSDTTIYRWSPPKNFYIAASFKYRKLPYVNLGKGRLTTGLAATDLYNYHDSDRKFNQWHDTFLYLGVEQQITRRLVWMLELDNLFLRNVKASFNTGFQFALNDASSISYTWRNIGSQQRMLERAMQFSYTLEY